EPDRRPAASAYLDGADGDRAGADVLDLADPRRPPPRARDPLRGQLRGGDDRWRAVRSGVDRAAVAPGYSDDAQPVPAGHGVDRPGARDLRGELRELPRSERPRRRPAGGVAPAASSRLPGPH